MLSVVTGSPEHDGYAVDFIEAIAEVEAKIPGVFAGATLAPSRTSTTADCVWSKLGT